MTSQNSQNLRRVATFLTGSRIYGLNSPDSDFDLRSVHVDPFWKVASGMFDSSAKVLSMEGEEDHVSHELSHFAKCLLKSSPNHVELLFIPIRIDEDFQPTRQSDLEEARELNPGSEVALASCDPVLEPLFEMRDTFLRTERFATACFGASKQDILKASALLKELQSEHHANRSLRSSEQGERFEMGERHRTIFKRIANAKRLLAMALEVQNGDDLHVSRESGPGITPGTDAETLRAQKFACPQTFSEFKDLAETFLSEAKELREEAKAAPELPVLTEEEFNRRKEEVGRIVFDIRLRLEER